MSCRQTTRRSSSHQSSFHKRLRIEALEQKNLLAGDVAVSVFGGNLSILGGVDDDLISLASTATAGEYVVTGIDGTTVMGMASLTIGGVLGDVAVDLGGGAQNHFEMFGTSLPGGLQVSSAGTQDSVTVGQMSLDGTRVTLGGDLSILMNGVNASFFAVSMDITGDVSVGGTTEYLSESVALGSLTVSGSIDMDVLLDNTGVLLVNINHVGGDVNLNLRGDGGDSSTPVDRYDFEINPTFLDSSITSPMVIDGNLNYTTTDEVNEGLFRQVEIGGDLVVVMGAVGNNSLEITELTAVGDILLTGGAGANDFVLSEVTAGNDLVYSGGDGDDTVELADTSTTIGDILLSSGLGVNDFIVLDTTAGDDLIFNGGDGVDTVELSVVSAGDDIRLNDGAGAGDYLLEGITTGDDLRMKAGAGGVSIAASTLVIGDDLVFKGGDGEDFFFIEHVTGVINTIGDDLYATGGAGLDEIGIEDVAVVDKLRISTGGGDDFAGIVNSTIGRSALISLGGGVNESEIEAVNAGRSLTVLGRGSNTIDLLDVTTTHFVTIVTTSGDDVVSLDQVFTRSALISTRAGEDEVTITESEFDYLFVLLGSGDDSLTLDGVTVDRFAFLHGGGGQDTLVDVEDMSGDSTNDINFELDFAFEIFENGA